MFRQNYDKEPEMQTKWREMCTIALPFRSFDVILHLTIFRIIMKPFIHILLLALVLALSSLQGHPAQVPGPSQEESHVCLATEEAQHSSHTDRLRDCRADVPESPMATLTDAGQSIRLCGERPQRLVPAHGPGYRSGAHTPSGNHTLSTLRLSYPENGYADHAPVFSVASRRYYIIALRHILC